MFRICYKCKVNKPLEDYYRDRTKTLGRDRLCKSCDDARGRFHATGTRSRYHGNEEYHKYYASTVKGKAAINKASKRAAQKFPEKWNTRSKTRYAVKKGLIIKQPCFCGEKSQAHHKDYTDHLRVTWLCAKHHAEHHVNYKYLTNYFIGI